MERFNGPFKESRDCNYTAEQHELPWNKNMESFAKLNAVLVI